MPDYDEGEESERDAAGSDGEQEPLWSGTEPANSQELARLGRAKEVKTQVLKEEEVPGASGATSLQLVKVEGEPGRCFGGGGEVSLHGGMLSLMGEMLQQMKEQNRQQADFHARSLARQQQQHDRMHELCKLAVSQPVLSTPPWGQAQGLFPLMASVTVNSHTSL